MSEDEDLPRIVVCRDIPGDHIGGPECFCCPTIVEIGPATTDEEVHAIVEAAQRMN